MWNEATITNRGLAVYNRWLGGEALTLTGAKGGDRVTDNPAAATDLARTKQTLTLAGTEAVSGGQRVKVRALSVGLETGYTLRQMGIWGRIGSETPVLLILLQDADGVAIPSQSENADFVLELSAFLQAVSAGSFSAVIDPDALATRAAVKAIVAAEAAARAAADEEIHQHLTSPYNFKGSLASAAALPEASAANANDTYYLIAEKYRVTSNGTAWEQSSMEESQYTDELAEVKSAFDNLDETVNGERICNYTMGKNIDSSGLLTDDPGSCASDFIPYLWTGSTRYYYGEQSDGYRICFYNSSKTFLQGYISNNNSEYRSINAEDQVTGTVAYVRFSFKKGFTAYCVKNANPLPSAYWTAECTTDGGLVNDVTALQATAPGAGELDAIETAINGNVAFNYTAGKGLDSSGELTNEENKCVSDYIPYTWDTTISTRYTYSAEESGITSGTYYICFYDSGKNFIKSFTNLSNGYRAIVPSTQLDSTPSFVRFSFKKGFEANVAQHNNTKVVYWVAEKSAVNGLKYAEMDSPEQIQATAATVTNGTITAIDSVDVRKNLDIEFRGDITAFTNVVIGHGYNHNYAAYIKIDSSGITVYRDDLDGSNNVAHTQIGDPIPFPDGFAIGTYLHVLIQQGDNGTATVTVNTASGRFKTQNIAFNGRRGDVFATITGTMTNVAVTAVIRDLNKSVWCFGDSYQSIGDATRWPYYLNDDGYLDNCLFSGFPGANSAHEIVSFRRLINLAQPKYLIWALGMNNSDTGAINALWKQCVDEVITTCEEKGVTIILATIPCVPARDHTYKNAYIKNPPTGAPTEGKRYIDFARCVGGETAGSYWYNWGNDPSTPSATAMLSSDKLHPSAYGAMALYAELLADAPEVMK